MAEEENDSNSDSVNEGFSLDTFVYSKRYLRYLLIGDIVWYSGARFVVWLLLATGSRESLDSYGIPLIGVAILGSFLLSLGQAVTLLIALIVNFVSDRSVHSPDSTIVRYQIGLLVINVLVLLYLLFTPFNVV